MSDPKKRPFRLQSWIPTSFAWTTSPDVFGIDVPLSDPDVVELVSTGICEIDVFASKKILRLTSLLMEEGLLRRQLQEAVWSPAKLKPFGSRVKVGAKVVAYCHGVFLLPDGRTLCVVVGRAKPAVQDAWISCPLKAEVDALLVEHQAKVAVFDEGIKLKEQEAEARKTRFQSDRDFGSWGNVLVAIEERQRPVVTIEPLLQLIPRAAKFPQVSSDNPDKVARAALAAIAASGLLPSRDGNYVGILTGEAGRRTQSLVSWAPHTGLPSYPEVRWAVQKRLPAVLSKPRSEQIGKPKFDTGSQPVEESVQVQGFDPVSNDLKAALDDLQFDQSDYRNRVDDIRKDAKGQGFEAIAWFQPYHVWTEETWGIYFDARKLDDLALSFLDDFKVQRVHGSHSLAALLAFGLTYAHELFHAKVEAALSWQEINAQQPRHLRYKERVYQALRETPDWLEEALANWSAWNWFNAPENQVVVARVSSNAEALTRVVEASLDLSPPGYQEWRLGHKLGTWRTFANQLSTGNPKFAVSGIELPIESTLTGPLPYDFQPSDIPLRFIGSGVISDRLQSQPATLNVISRRELQKALKFYRHVVDVSAGNGSHEKWTGPDNRAFPVPRTDPVSYTVFKSFLQYIGIDKSIYIKQVRPNL